MRILCEFSCIIKPHHSRLLYMCQEEATGLYWGMLRKPSQREKTLLQKSDYIVSPMCEFEFHGYLNIPKGAWIKIQVPHILKNATVHSKVTVMSRTETRILLNMHRNLGKKKNHLIIGTATTGLFEELLKFSHSTSASLLCLPRIRAQMKLWT